MPIFTPPINHKNTSNDRPVRVLVVDDSPFVRQLMIHIINSSPGIEVVGEAENGFEAIEKNQSLRPDIITMDIRMPKMDGREAISEIMAFHPVPILVVTDVDDAHEAYNAISHGALEFLGKSEIDPDAPTGLTQKLKLLARVPVISHVKGRRRVRSHQESGPSRSTRRVVAIASSTGGPKALSVIISQLPATFPYPILISQHIHADFVPSLVQWLNGLSALNVVVASEKDELRPGFVYVSPADFHLQLRKDFKFDLKKIAAGDLYRPSCDRLLSSVAGVCEAQAIGVILTGMGDDGARGLSEIKRAGGVTIAQDEKSSVVFGMPQVAINLGCVDSVAPLGDIADLLVKL